MTKRKSTQAAQVLGRLGGLKGGKASTPAKRRAAKANGKKGWRPPKSADAHQARADREGVSRATAKARSFAEVYGVPH